MILGDIEAVAGTLYRAAGFSLDVQAPPLAIAERLLGDGAIRTAPAEAMASRGALVRVGSNWRVYLNAGCDAQQKRFVLMHELSHWALPDATEETCDRLAAALLLPRPAFLAAVAHHGARLATLARRFGTTESCAALRLGEATASPVALVTPLAVRKRGAAFGWPADAVLRARVRVPGVRKCRLTDALQRLMLQAV